MVLILIFLLNMLLDQRFKLFKILTEELMQLLVVLVISTMPTQSFLATIFTAAARQDIFDTNQLLVSLFEKFKHLGVVEREGQVSHLKMLLLFQTSNTFVDSVVFELFLDHFSQVLLKLIYGSRPIPFLSFFSFQVFVIFLDL
jgi:hypothetical protein